MLECYKEQTSWWHEMLHKLVHDGKSGSTIVFKPQLFKEWRACFEEGEWKEVFEGKGTEGERLYLFIQAPDADRKVLQVRLILTARLGSARVGGLCRVEGVGCTFVACSIGMCFENFNVGNLLD